MTDSDIHLMHVCLISTILALLLGAFAIVCFGDDKPVRGVLFTFLTFLCLLTATVAFSYATICPIESRAR